MNWEEKLKKRWGVKSRGHVLIILLVFACTGMTSLYVKQGLYFLAGITENTENWIKITYRIFATFAAYQVLLLAYGWLFGQFKFFWEFEKKIIRRFRRKRKQDQE